MPNQYEASTRIYVDTQSVLKPLMSGLAVQPNIEQQVVMLSRTLLGRPNVEKLVRMADLDLNLKTQEKRDALIDRLIKDIQIAGSSDNLYSIRYRDPSPERAKRVVDSLLSIFVESGLGNKRRDTEKATAIHRRADQRLREAAAGRRAPSEGLQTAQHVGAWEAQMHWRDGRSGGATQSNAARAAFGRAIQGRPEARAGGRGAGLPARSFRHEERPRSRATQPPPRSTSRIETLKGNLDELLRKYTDQHPDVVGTRRIIADLEKQREEQLEARKKALPTPAAGETRAVQNIDRNPVFQQLKLSLADAEATVAGLRARVGELEARYNQVKSTAQLRPELEEELVQLNRNYQVDKTNYDQLIMGGSRRNSPASWSKARASRTFASSTRLESHPRRSRRTGC